MTRILGILGRSTGTIAAGASRFTPLAAGCRPFSVTTESITGFTTRSPGVFSLLGTKILSNGITAASTMRFRKNAANGNQVISIAASTSGNFQDTTNKDAVVAADTYNMSLVVGATGTTLVHAIVWFAFEPSRDFACRTGGAGVTYSTASTTFFHPIFGDQADNAVVEATSQFKVKQAATMRNLDANVRVNTRAQGTTVSARKNGSNGNPSVSVTGSTTGHFEDTSGTNALVADDLICGRATTGTGTGNFRVNIGFDFVSTNFQQFTGGQDGTGAVVSANTTVYLVVAGDPTGSATESDVQVPSPTEFLSHGIRCYISANTVTANSTLVLRVEGANGNQSVSITDSTTGWFEDLVGADLVQFGNGINYALTTGATGTTLTMNSVGMISAFPNNRLLLMGTGS